MHHLSAKNLVAAVAAAALLGAAAPAAVAAPSADRPSHAAEKADRDAAKADRKAARDTAKASKVDARVDRALTRLAESHKLERLEDATEDAVRLNILADAALDGAGLRPSTYRQVINQLAFAERLLAAAEGNTEATADVQAVVTTLVSFTAATDKAELRTTKRSLQEWAELLEDETEETQLEDETPEPIAPIV